MAYVYERMIDNRHWKSAIGNENKGQEQWTTHHNTNTTHRIACTYMRHFISIDLVIFESISAESGDLNE